MTIFVGLEDRPQWKELPSEAIIINGVALDEAIRGFRTLNVKGRELIGKEVDTVNVAGRDGALYLGSKLPTRTLTVTYSLVAEDNRQFRESFERLNKIFNDDNLEIRFRDDLRNYYTGTLTSVADISPGMISLVSEFIFLCTDPYKYSDPVVEEGENEVIFNIPTFYDTTPRQMSVYPLEDTSTITINSGNKQVQLVEGSFVSGREVEIDFSGDEIKARSGGQDFTNKIALHSDLEDFYIKEGQPVEFEEGGRIRVTTREVSL